MKFSKLTLIILYIYFLSGCEIFYKKPKHAIAKYKSNYLFYEDIENNVPKNLTQNESLLFVKNEIAKWAKNHILVENAKINIEKDQQNQLLGQVEAYNDQLFSHHYKEKIVKALMDTLVDKKSIFNYYEKNKSNFKLNEDIIQGRYIKLPKENFEISLIRNKFRRFNKNDISFLDSISLQFTSFSFNDSSWINKDVFFSKFPLVKDYIKNNIVKKYLFYQLEDSLELYLIKVNQSVLKNENAPLKYMEPTLRQILVNKRKLEFIANFENELYNNAIQTRELELYE